MSVIDEIVKKAKLNKKRIVLPESEDLRILKAASKITLDNIADIILVGNKEVILKTCADHNIDISNVKIVNNLKSEKLDIYASELYNLRKNKGVTLDSSYEMLKDNMYYATMMVKMGDADGMVSGASHSTADTLRPALQIIKSNENVKTVSSFFVMETTNKSLGLDGKFIFADCGLVAYPTKEELVDIVISSRKSFKDIFEVESKIAMLSYSTKGSAKHENIDKLNDVVNIVKGIDKNITIDGELQLDAAIIEDVAKLKAPHSDVAGHANILVFPDLDAGNIGYKIAQRFGNMIALGPVTQGLKKPVNDLSRGCNVDDIVGVVAITCLQAR